MHDRLVHTLDDADDSLRAIGEFDNGTNFTTRCFDYLSDDLQSLGLS